MNNESLFARTRLLTLLGALTALTVGSMVLLGWMLDLPVLRSLVSGAVQMKANTAVGLVAIGAGVLLHSRGRGREWPRLALSLAVAGLGAATLFQFLSGQTFGIDQLLFADTAHPYTNNPGRMSPFTAWGFLMFGTWLTVADRRRWLWLRLLCAAQVTLIGAIAALGYLWNASELVTNMWVSPVAVNTALVFIVLGVGLLAGDLPAAARCAEEYRAFSGVERKLVVAAWSMLLVLVVSSGYTYRTYLGFVGAAHRVTHIHEMRLDLARLGGCLDHLEAAQRHYMMLGDRSYKAEYKARLASCRDTVPRIRALASGNDLQMSRASKLQELVDERLQVLEEMSGIYDLQGLEAARAALADGRGPRVMRDIERVVAEMDGVERNLLAILEKGQEEGRTAMLVSILLTLAISVAIFAGPIRAIRKALRKSAAARDQRRQQEALLSALINSIPDVIAYKNRDGLYLGCNRAYAAMLGKTPDEVIGRTTHELFSRDQADGIQSQDLLVLGGMETSAEEWFTYQGGRRELLHVKRNPLRDQDGRVTGMLAIGREITERKKAEEEVRQAKELAEGATRMKSDFLANMSHEIRTPMTGVLGMIDILAADKLTAVQKGYVEHIRSSGRHLLNVINDILDFSKLETGKLELERIDFSVPELLDSLRSLTRHLAVARGLQLHFQLDADVPEVVRGDPRRLTQVLLNLVGNAIKFTEHGSVTVRASRARESDSGIRLHFEVCDTGIGIAAKTLAQLFAPFVQADSSTGRRYGGSGLGLAICKRLVEAMSGTIGATSEPGWGSRFFFDLPLERGDPQGVVPHGTASAAPPRPRRILIAEDFEMNREILQAALGKQGHDLVFATNGSEAVDWVRRQAFDVVLMDVQMPVMDGVEATRRIRNLDGPARDVTIIGLTANVMARDRDRYLEAGMNGCLMKPIDWDELAAAIGRCGTAALPAPALVDAKVLAALGRVVGEDQMQSLVRQGIETYRNYCASMAAGHSGLSSFAHKLKGSAGTLGLHGISAAAVRIDSAIASGLDGAPLVRELAQTIEATLQELVKLGIVGDDAKRSSP